MSSISVALKISVPTTSTTRRFPEFKDIVASPTKSVIVLPDKVNPPAASVSTPALSNVDVAVAQKRASVVAEKMLADRTVDVASVNV